MRCFWLHTCVRSLSRSLLLSLSLPSRARFMMWPEVVNSMDPVVHMPTLPDTNAPGPLPSYPTSRDTHPPTHSIHSRAFALMSTDPAVIANPNVDDLGAEFETLQVRSRQAQALRLSSWLNSFILTARNGLRSLPSSTQWLAIYPMAPMPAK